VESSEIQTSRLETVNDSSRSECCFRLYSTPDFVLISFFSLLRPPPSPEGVRSIGISMSVCQSVSLSFCLSARITRNRTTELQLFVHVVCGHGSVLLLRRCDIGPYYVLLVLRMTSCFHIVGPVGTTICLEEFARWRYQLDVRQLQCSVERRCSKPIVSSLAMSFICCRRTTV